MLEGPGIGVVSTPDLAVRPRARTPGRSPGSPAIFKPGGALGLVAAARGIAEKNRRDLPRLLREAPPKAEESASLLNGLHLLDSAAMSLAEVVRRHIAPGLPRHSAKRPGSPRRSSSGIAGRTGGVRVEEATEGPAELGGTYIVIFRLDAEVTITVGALGTFAFPPGFYSYVGSAFGPGGVRARTGRHRTPVKERKKWNIDFLTPHATAAELWWTHDTVRRECLWSATLAKAQGFDCPAREFGARDCRKAPALRIGNDLFRCPAHLYRSPESPDVHDFAIQLARLAPGHAPVFRLPLFKDNRPVASAIPSDKPRLRGPRRRGLIGGSGPA